MAEEVVVVVVGKTSRRRAGVVHEEEEVQGVAVEEEGSPQGYEEWVGLGCRNGWWPGS